MDESGLKKSVVQSEIGTFGKVSEMARSGGLFTPFGPSSQAPTLFRFALLEPEEVLIISVALTNLLIKRDGWGKYFASGKVSEMARSGGLFTPFGPSSQAPTLFRFALLEPEEVLIISVALTNLLINEMGGENILLRGRFLKWRAREDSNLRPPGS
tara:strand:- start:106109 stop:106576 length:468 start_codon:yes stop_codon:yes gene_type:complete